MSDQFYQLLKPFIWPRYYEEGPPRYIDFSYLGKEFVDTDGRLKEPLKSVIDLIIMGYRPVTSLSIFSILVEKENKPMYGSQIGAELENKFQLPKGWFTKTRYYDTRIGKLLKTLQRQNILEEMKVKNGRMNKEYNGYRITEKIYPALKDRILSLHRGERLLFLTPIVPSDVISEKSGVKKYCSKCDSLTYSASARYCELCGNPLKLNCPKCGKEMSLEYLFCLNCGMKF